MAYGRDEQGARGQVGRWVDVLHTKIQAESCTPAHLPGEALAIHVDLEVFGIEVQNWRVVGTEEGLVRGRQAVA